MSNITKSWQQKLTDRHGLPRKYWHYLFVVSILAILLSA